MAVQRGRLPITKRRLPAAQGRLPKDVQRDIHLSARRPRGHTRLAGVPQSCNKCEDPATAAHKDRCVSWRQTSGCQPTGKRQPHEDQSCTTKIKSGSSGYCECDAGVRAAESACEHPPFTCADKCAEQWAFLRKQREQRQDGAGGGAAAEEEFSADDAQSKLYKRGKQFYVMGNTELALRHFREALKLDPEHTATKREYKQAKKLAKLWRRLRPSSVRMWRVRVGRSSSSVRSSMRRR